MESKSENTKKLEKLLIESSTDLIYAIKRISNFEKLPADWHIRIKKELGKASKHLKNYPGWKEEEVDPTALKIIKLVQEYHWAFLEEDVDQESPSKYINEIAESVSTPKNAIHPRTVRRYVKDYNNYVNESGRVRPIALIAIKDIEEEKNNKELIKEMLSDNSN